MPKKTPKKPPKKTPKKTQKKASSKSRATAPAAAAAAATAPGEAPKKMRKKASPKSRGTRPAAAAAVATAPGGAPPQAGKKQYDVTIPERDEIIQLLQDAQAPRRAEEIARAFNLDSPEEQTALSHRLKAMLRDGQLIRNRRAGYGLLDKMDLAAGRVIGHPEGYGFLRPDAGGADLYLAPRQMRAVLHGDHVVARSAGVDRRGRGEGVIVEVLERVNHTVVGRFFLEGGVAFVVPDNRRIHQDILVPRQRKKAQTGDYVVVEITHQPDAHTQPLGRVIEVLGRSNSVDMATEIAIRAYDIPHQWPAAVERELAALGRAHWDDGRRDLRELPLATIDGEDAADFDDAVYCERQGDEWRLVVAIADVSHFVKAGTALDEEARQRGNSVYFPNRVVPMLPEALSNDLCSLRPGEDRAAMVCDLRVNRVGRVRQHLLYPALINSSARLTYGQVDSLLSGAAPAAEHKSMAPHVKNLHELYACMRGYRKRHGVLDFSSKEVRLRFNEQGRIAAIETAERYDSHRLIEEFMLAANVAVAEFLLVNKTPALFRNHATPDKEKINDLNLFLADFGLRLGGGAAPGARHYAKVLKLVENRDDRRLVETVLLRSMPLAVYEGKNGGHFGLAFEHYAHFTSPIRRYPDLLAHRAIRHVIERADYAYSGNDMHNFGAHCSMTERRAEEAVRDVVARMKCEFMLDKVGRAFAGIVSGVTGFGLFVELDGIYVEGLAHISALPADYYHFDPIAHSLSGERTGRKYFLGDRIKITVSGVNVDERKIDFECAG